jgi:hypothetical protein
MWAMMPMLRVFSSGCRADICLFLEEQGGGRVVEQAGRVPAANAGPKSGLASTQGHRRTTTGLAPGRN